MNKILKTPVIFIDWLRYQRSFKDGLIEMPFRDYWRLR